MTEDRRKPDFCFHRDPQSSPERPRCCNASNSISWEFLAQPELCRDYL